MTLFSPTIITGIAGEETRQHQVCSLLSRYGLPYRLVQTLPVGTKVQTETESNTGGQLPLSFVLGCIDDTSDDQFRLLQQLDAALPRSSLLVALIDQDNFPWSTFCRDQMAEFAAIALLPSPDYPEIMEIYQTEETADETLRFLTDFADTIHCYPLLINHVHSLFLIRILLDVLNETWYMSLSTGLTTDHIERVAIKTHFPAGLFGLLERYGMNNLFRSFQSVISQHPDPHHYKSLLEHLKCMQENETVGKRPFRDEQGEAGTPLGSGGSISGDEIADYLRNTWLSASKRFTQTAHVPLYDANMAIRIFFRTRRGPFEQG